MFQHTHTALRACFKLPPTTLHSLAKAVICVALGLRASHLIDVTHLSCQQSRLLLEQLRQHPDGQQLLVIQLKDRFTFLCHKQRLKELVHTTLENPDLRYVDVERKDPIERACPLLLTQWIEERLVPFLSSDRWFYSTDILPCFTVTLTGWLLEYPVIYTTHPENSEIDTELDEWEPRTNCLGGQLLNLFRVWIKGLEEGKPEDSYMLMSFTYPDHVFPDNQEKTKKRVEDRVNKRIKDASLSRKTMAWVTTEQVTLDRVAL